MSGATQAQIEIAFKIMRQSIDATGWGGWVSDDKLMPEAIAVANAVHAAEPRPPVVAPNPAPPPVKPPAQSGNTQQGSQS